MKKIKRREFLKTSVNSAACLVTPGLFTGCKNSDQKVLKKARVAAVRGDNLDSMTRDALDALGGIRTVVNKGDIVFIKPNFCHISMGAV